MAPQPLDMTSVVTFGIAFGFGWCTSALEEFVDIMSDADSVWRGCWEQDLKRRSEVTK